MDDNIVGLAAVVMCLGIPMAAMYTYYRVKRLRTEERLAALEPELSEMARSRRSGILLVTGALGYIATFGLIARSESEAWIAAALGIIPLAIGLGFFLDAYMIRRDLRTS